MAGAPRLPGTQNRPYNYLGRPDLDPLGVGGGDCDVATGGFPAQNGFDNVVQQNYITVHDVATSNIQVSDSSDGGYIYKSNRPAINFKPGAIGDR